MILITGATGHVGSEVLRQTIEAEASVRALVRDPEKAKEIQDSGVEIVEGNFANPASLDSAFEGVERLFLLSGAVPDQVDLESNAIDAAVRAGVHHVVKQSIYGTEIGSSAPYRDSHGQIEEKLQSSGLGFTFLRPTFFMQSIPSLIAPDGNIYAPTGDGRIGWVDIRDIAAVARHALTEDGHESDAYEITGPESLSFAEVAEKLSAATGQEINYVDVPAEAAKEGMISAGMPEWLADANVTLMTIVREGGLDVVTDTVEKITGAEPRSVDSFAREYASALSGSSIQ